MAADNNVKAFKFYQLEAVSNALLAQGKVACDTPDDSASMVRFRLLDTTGVEIPTFSNANFTNTGNYNTVEQVNSHEAIPVITYNTRFNRNQPASASNPPWVPAPKGEVAKDENGKPLKPGEVFMSKQDAVKLTASYLQLIADREHQVEESK